MTAAAIDPGDVVTLKSGGPDMTVELVGSLSDEGAKVYASVAWLDEAGKLQRNRLPVYMLKKKQ